MGPRPHGPQTHDPDRAHEEAGRRPAKSVIRFDNCRNPVRYYLALSKGETRLQAYISLNSVSCTFLRSWPLPCSNPSVIGSIALAIVCSAAVLHAGISS